MAYFCIAQGLRGCYMPDNAYMVKVNSRKELKAILESSDEPEKKTKRFIDKIKSFGSDVASNILANLLTNPKVYEQLGGMS